MNKKITCDGEEFELVPIRKTGEFPLQIVVLDRGFVYIGRVEKTVDGIIIHDCKNIRYYGTKCGLGELALNGMRPETKLDPAGTVRANTHAVMHLIDCEESKWQK